MKLKFFELAKAVSKQSDHPDHALGAVIVKKNKVISVGFNTMKTHPKCTFWHQRTHAELSAIIKAKTDLRGCTIYIYREDKMGKLSISRPCYSCMAVIEMVGIKYICYTTSTGYKKEKVNG